MEVKIGVQHTPREVVIESEQTADEVDKLVTDAMTEGGLLTLVDTKGKRVLVPASIIAYVEIDRSDSRRVGFTAG
ncbi:MAG: DUF3107 domain-containing protein [bacterium]